MLGWFRKFVKSWVGFALFVLLIISFGIFFRDPFKGFVGGGFVEIDGGHSVEQRDVNREVEAQLTRIREEQNKILSPRDAAAQGLTQQILSQLIYRGSVLSFADKLGVKASSSAVTTIINSAPRFKDSLGRLNMDAVRAYASQQGFNLDQWLNNFRDDITVGYVESAALTGLTTPEILTKPLLSYYGEQRTVSLARLSPTSIPEPKAPTDEELKAWYEKNKQRFAQPERRRMSVLSYSAEDFKDKAEAAITDAQVKAEYDRRIQEFSTPGTRELAQFTGPDRNTLQTLVDTVKQGMTLDEALKKTPNVTRVNMNVKPSDLTDKKYSDYVFAIPENQLMGPIQVGQSWYVVQVNKITPGIPTPLEQVAEKIRSGLADSEASRLYNASEESFYDMAGGVALEEMSKQVGAPVIELPPVDRNAQTRHGEQSTLLAQFPDAIRTAFGLTAGQTTDVVEADGKRAILRLDEVVAPHTLSLEEAKADAQEGYLAEKRLEAASKMAGDTVAAVKAGKTFQQAATANKMTVLGSVPLVRGMQAQIDPNIFAAAFKQQVGEAAVVKGQSAEPWVVKVDSMAPLPPPETAAALKTQLETDVSQSLQADVREVFIRGVQKEVRVKPNEGAIDAYFKSLTQEEAQ